MEEKVDYLKHASLVYPLNELVRAEDGEGSLIVEKKKQQKWF
jgi:hypothetical protein